MNDEQLKKALECCRVEGHCADECPYYSNLFKGKAGCLDEKEGIIPKALDLINRQSAEIDILIRKKHTLRDEIDRLNFLLKEAWESIEQKDRRTETIKSEAYNEFAERLCEGRVSNDPVVIAVKVELSEVSDNA